MNDRQYTNPFTKMNNPNIEFETSTWVGGYGLEEKIKMAINKSWATTDWSAKQSNATYFIFDELYNDGCSAVFIGDFEATVCYAKNKFIRCVVNGYIVRMLFV
jgi:hypothetical protein